MQTLPNPHNPTPARGSVALVGGGPGDPGLLTLRGKQLLELAEVVVYDFLSNPRLLDHCNPDVEIIYAGKKAAAHFMSQEQINALLVEKALSGKRVVRLKGGDPFVFGRGGEECEALHAAGIPFEVVPGITAAIAAPAYAGIPVTHRDFNSSFTFITGHEKEDEHKDGEALSRQSGAGSSDIDWSVIAKLPCLAFYMGVKSLPRICEKLIAHGMSPDMPAATIRWGTHARQQTIIGTLETLAARVAEAKIRPPALTIVGRVVTLRDTLNWFETRPLFGQTIVVTRTRHQASDLSTQLRELGADVIEAPTIELHPPADPSRIIAALHDVNTAEYDWVVFTSANAVHQVKAQLYREKMDARAFAGLQLAAIGDATALALERELGLRADLVPPQAVAEVLADVLEGRREVAGKRLLLLRADIGRPILVERLRTAGAARVDDIAIYETRPAASLPDQLLEALDAKQVTWATFTSSSTARNFVRLLGENYREKLSGVKIASIGPVTTQSLTELGLAPTVQASDANIAGLVEAIVNSAASSA